MYQVIARKYRPQSFADVVNQEHVKTTLENAIAQHRIAHGYIFSSQRGTGKTTIARILARCLNCIQGPTATPCGECASCKEITDRKSTRLNSSHRCISYAVFCLKKNKTVLPVRRLERCRLETVRVAHSLPTGLVQETVYIHFFFNDAATTEIYTLSLHDALPI